MPTELRLPIRQGTRLLNEFQLAGTVPGLTVVGGNLDRATVFLMVLRSALRAPTASAVSANAIATSLGRPLETIRRHMQKLVALGLCRQEERRFVPVDGLLELPAVAAAGARLLALFRALLVAASGSGLDVPGGAHDRDDRVALIAALDVLLAIYELSEAPASNTTDLYVIGAVAVLNAAGITHDPALSRRYAYADTVPPESLRRPVSARAIAAAAGLSGPTIWRHAAALADAGALVAVPGGYLLGQQWMDNPQTSLRSHERVVHFGRIVRRLAASN